MICGAFMMFTLLLKSLERFESMLAASGADSDCGRYGNA